MLIDTIKTLCELSGVSGCEDEVREYITLRAKPYADEMRTDSMGNLMILRKGIKDTQKPIMLTAHMDEVGVICKGYTDDGCIKFGFVGEVNKNSVIGRRILFEGGILGVIGIKAVHLTTKSERESMPKTKDLYIDIGCESKKQAQKKVPLGNYGAFSSESIQFGDSLIKAKAIDGRAGCAVLMELLKKQPTRDTWFVFTVQKEVNMRGAKCAAFSINPALCLVLDGCNADDLPSTDKKKQICRLRHGVVISFMDEKSIYDKKICTVLEECAKDSGISWQAMQSTSGQTDAGTIYTNRGGIKTGVISIPVRYIHSPSCTASEDDINGMLLTVKEFTERVGNSDEF